MTDKTIPEVVCLCGSTRFKDAYRAENARLTLEGKIVLSVGFFHHAGDTPPGVAEEVRNFEDSETKADLDELHKRKIDLADRVHVINPGGYIGESTESEIAYARNRGIPVTFYEDTEYPLEPIVDWVEDNRHVFLADKGEPEDVAREIQARMTSYQGDND